VLFVFATAVHTSILGALLTVGQGVWYARQSQAAAAFRLTALEDQALAGLVMWVPSGLAFVAIGVALFAAWLGEAERRVRRLEGSRFGKLEHEASTRTESSARPDPARGERT
jgi:cytochrome c oxidase assembly factor CtaG